MPLVFLGVSVLLLLLFIVRFKLNAFLALLLTSFLIGLFNGMSAETTLRSIVRGIGDTMGSLVLILVFGAILGKLISESGAAQTISYALTGLCGVRRIQISMLLTGLIVGIPMIYNASFLVLIPLVYTLSETTGLPLLYLGIPLSAALSVSHGFLPPHPAPTSIAVMYGADVNRTLLYGLILAVPAALLAGPLLARFFRDSRNAPPPELYQSKVLDRDSLPGLSVSLLTTMIPVILMLVGALVTMTAPHGGRLVSSAKFLSDPNVALLVAVLVGFYTLGLRRGRKMESLMKSTAEGVASVSMVILIIASGGGFKQVLLDSGTGNAVEQLVSHAHLSPILMVWCAAALMRLALGSATVAAITAAGIMLPVARSSGVPPELLVIATTSGSLMFSHFNDIGFWMFKEYYNATVKQTFQVWTVMESIVGLVGLGGVLLLNVILGPTAAAAETKGGSIPLRVYYINSYHQGYPPSDAVMAAIRQILPANGVDLRVAFLDAKRDAREADLRRRADEIVSAIHAFHPDLLIASDDDAVKYVIVPHFRNGPTPVVFTGVNWSARQYELPAATVTGMLEVVPITETLREVMKEFPDSRRLLVLSEDSTSERSNREFLDARFRSLGLKPDYVFVPDYMSWRKAFVEGQQEYDIVYLPTNGGILGWDGKDAAAWVAQHLRKPTVTCDDFMMQYAAFGLTKVPAEQGEWAAHAALEILKGKSPNAIAVTENKETKCFMNSRLAARIGFHAPSGMTCKEWDAIN
jgi:gluconate transporter